jgi:phosphopantothenoylcysteine decarboxylase/phosphopantothenate--cysteine ligase
MHCIVTAGPTFEPLDEVRRLTNFSTGRLGSELASFLAQHGHEVTLLIGEAASWHGERRAAHLHSFTTTADLRERLGALSSQPVGAVFHAAAVSDFAFGKIWLPSPQGELREIKSGKLSTRHGTLLAELVATPKLISELRGWFPKALLVGWKYEIDGNRANTIRLAEKQIAESLTDACVANGRAYGAGFGLARRGEPCAHLPDANALFVALERFLVG